MKIVRLKKFTNDFSKVKISDTQFAKFIKYSNCFLDDLELPKDSKDHMLKGEYKGFREFHIGGDMLVVYFVRDDAVTLVRIGTHSQLFK